MNAGKLLWAGALLVSAGCVTEPGDLGAVSGTSGGETAGAATSETGEASVTSDGSGGPSSSSGEESGETGEPIDPQCDFDVGEGVDRAMTARQFEHAVADLFGVVLEVDFGGGEPFDTQTAISVADQAAIDVAAAQAAAAFDVPVCGGDETSCAQSFIDEIAPIALRGQADHDALLTTYEEAASHEEGIRAVVEAMISDPAFADVSPTGTMDGDLLQLDGVSVATRLALLMWNSVPDAALLASADSLLEDGGIEAELARMFEDPRYARAQGDLYMMLTNVDELETVDRGQVDESWSASTAAAMLEEQRRFVSDLAEDADATLGDLLTSSSSSVNAELAVLYGDDLQTPVPGGSGWGPAELDPSHRAGILTQLGFLARHSRNVSTDEYQTPTGRGIALNKAVSCFQTPLPPGIKPFEEDFTDRETWEENVETPPTCGGCHALFDPQGHAFGNYDGLGRWFESGNALDGTMNGLEIEFENAVDLSAQLAGHEEVRTCVARRHFEFALRRDAAGRDSCTIEALAETFDSSGGNLRALVEAVATAEAFVLARP